MEKKRFWKFLKKITAATACAVLAGAAYGSSESIINPQRYGYPPSEWVQRFVRLARGLEEKYEPELLGEKVILEALRQEHFERLQEVIGKQTAEWLEWEWPIGGWFHRFMVSKVRSMQRGDAVHYTIIERKSGEIAGLVGIREPYVSNSYAQLSIWLGEKFWRRGLSYEAIILAARDFLGRRPWNDSITSEVRHDNVASQGLMRKLGMELVACSFAQWREKHLKKGDNGGVIFRISREDFEAMYGL